MRNWKQIDTPMGPMWVQPGHEEAARELATLGGAAPAPAAAPAEPEGDPAPAAVVHTSSFWRSPFSWMRL